MIAVLGYAIFRQFYLWNKAQDNDQTNFKVMSNYPAVTRVVLYTVVFSLINYYHMGRVECNKSGRLISALREIIYNLILFIY